jgi:hypothetical protein
MRDNPVGYRAEAIWDTSQTCSALTCTTTIVTVPDAYAQYRDLAGNTYAIVNHAVPVGAQPVLLENK